MKANILLPGSNPDKSDERCPTCGQMLYYGKAKLMGSYICVHCSFQKKIEERPKAELTSDDHPPMLVQGKGKKRDDLDDLLPKGAFVVKEEDFNYQ
jgi:DNA-directed RNA polymerase subunit M/transcription elongation factor TFIIS